MSSDRVAELLAEIEAAFGDVPHPDWASAWNDPTLSQDWEIQEFEQEIPDTFHWKDVNPNTLRGMAGMMLQLSTPTAFPYILAAFLWHAIGRPADLDVGQYYLAGWASVDSLTEHGQRQFTALTDKQKTVLFRCIKHMAETDNWLTAKCAPAIRRWGASG